MGLFLAPLLQCCAPGEEQCSICSGAVESWVPKDHIALAALQQPDGAFAPVDLPEQTRVRRTGLALMAFQSQGYSKSSGETYAGFKFRDVIANGLEYLRRVQTADGGFGHWADTNLADSSVGAWALCEAYSYTGSRRYHDGAQSAVDFLAAQQLDDGGWGSIEATAFALLALRSASYNGLDGVREVQARAAEFAFSVGPPPASPEAEALMAGLGSDDYDTREAASAALAAAGPGAWRPLARATRSPDMEVARRAQLAMRSIALDRPTEAAQVLLVRLLTNARRARAESLSLSWAVSRHDGDAAYAFWASAAIVPLSYGAESAWGPFVKRVYGPLREPLDWSEFEPAVLRMLARSIYPQSICFSGTVRP